MTTKYFILVFFNTIRYNLLTVVSVANPTVRDVIDYADSNGLPIVIGADCNAHHTVWGSSDINQRGEKLMEYLATTSLEIMNNGTKPTFVNRVKEKVIDDFCNTESVQLTGTYQNTKRCQITKS